MHKADKKNIDTINDYLYNYKTPLMKKIIYLFITFLILINHANAQWQQTSLDNNYVESLAIKGDTIVAGTGDGSVYFSSNSGSSWEATGLTNTFFHVISLAISGNNIFAVLELAGVALSSDNGVTWIEVDSGLTDCGNVHCLAVKWDTIFAGTNSGVFLSTNNGGIWTQVNGLTDTVINALAVSGNNIYAGTTNGLFSSTDNGANWTALNIGCTGYPYTNISSLFIAGDTIYAGTNCGVFFSTNNGDNWYPAVTVFDAKSFTISGNNIYAGVVGGVFLFSNNGNGWASANIGLTDKIVYSLAIFGSDIFAGTNSGVLKRPLSDIIGLSCSAQFILIPDTMTPHHYYAINNAQGVSPLSYSWYWGDGTYDTIAYPSHIYDTAGYYNICLIITDSVGCSSTFCDSSYLQKSPNTIINVDVIPSGSIGINELSNSLDVSVFPNPVTDKITIIIPDKATIEISNINGQIIKTINHDSGETSFDIRDLSSGVYIIRAKTEKEIVTKKFIKQ
jgi:photosystem II stability/assembly factor-like uncharacterized protein